jgi:hypothetical protein
MSSRMEHVQPANPLLISVKNKRSLINPLLPYRRYPYYYYPRPYVGIDTYYDYPYYYDDYWNDVYYDDGIMGNWDYGYYKR